MQSVDGVDDVRVFHLAGEILKGPERLVVLGVGEGIRDVALDFVLNVLGVAVRLRVGMGSSQLLRVRASVRVSSLLIASGFAKPLHAYGASVSKSSGLLDASMDAT